MTNASTALRRIAYQHPGGITLQGWQRLGSQAPDLRYETLDCLRRVPRAPGWMPLPGGWADGDGMTRRARSAR